jgi:carbon-monoxide dehydrogenase iron sulfur subunit
VFDPSEIEKKEASKEEKASTPSRRDFLKGMAIGAGGLAVSSLLARQAGAIDLDVVAMKPSIRGEAVAAGRLCHDYRKCVGCRVCEMACCMKNDGQVRPFLSRIQIYRYEPAVFIGIACQQCGDRPCVNACPVEPDKDGRRALYEDPNTKALAVNDRCIKCGKCIEACATQRNGNLKPTDEGGPRGFCILCGECVKQCPQNALSIMPRTTDGRYDAKPADELAKWAINTLYGGPKVIIDNFK